MRNSSAMESLPPRCMRRRPLSLGDCCVLDQARAEYIKTCLIEHDFDVVACFTLDHLNIFKLEHLQADVILLDMDHPHRDVI